MAEESLATEPEHGQAARPGGMPRALRALSHRRYRLLLASNFYTGMAQWVQAVGQGWLVFDLTHSPLKLGLVSLFQGVGMLIFTPIGGALADRMDRQRLIMFTQVVMLCQALALAVLVSTGAVQVWHVMVISFVSGSMFGFSSPTRQAVISDLVGKEDLTNAIAMNMTVMHSMRIFGPTLAGLLIATVDVQGTFFLQAGAYLVAMVVIMALGRIPAPQQAADRPPFVRSMREGFAHARENRVLFDVLIILYISSSLGMAYLNMMPAFAGDVLGLEGGSYGFLMVALGIGGVSGAAMNTVKTEWRRPGLVLIGVMCLTGVALMLMGGVGTVAATVPALMMLGVANATVVIVATGQLQTRAEDKYRGRVMALYSLSYSIMPMGSLVMGAVAEQVGLREVFVGTGALVLAAIAWVAATSARVRRL